MENTKITNSDLNQIDFMNGSANISSKSTFIINNADESLKGALSQYNDGFSQEKELFFIRGIQNQLFEYQTERYNYIDLPNGLTKYRIETKILRTGSAFITKVDNTFYVLNYTTIKFNIYNEPMEIQINEPKSLLNSRKFVVGKDGIIIRNNSKMMSIYKMSYRFISDLEKILFQIEKNLLASAPKGILNLKNGEFDEPLNQSKSTSLEQIINGQNTFYTIKSKSIETQNLAADNGDQLFIPIELTDRTANLITNYSFVKEQLKELVGAMPNMIQGKKERTITSEIDNQDSFATATRQHSFNIREIDLLKFNKMYSENVIIEYQSDKREITDEEGN